MKTFMANAQTVERKWYVVDADGMTLGRLASQVAAILRGKNKPTYTPHCDTGDHVIVINAAKVVLTGKKLDQKVYYHHSGYAGGLKETKYRKLMAEKPEFAVKHAIIGMMPKGPLGRQMARKLRVYAGAEELPRVLRGGKLFQRPGLGRLCRFLTLIPCLVLAVFPLPVGGKTLCFLRREVGSGLLERGKLL